MNKIQHFIVLIFLINTFCAKAQDSLYLINGDIRYVKLEVIMPNKLNYRLINSQNDKSLKINTRKVKNISLQNQSNKRSLNTLVDYYKRKYYLRNLGINSGFAYNSDVNRPQVHFSIDYFFYENFNIELNFNTGSKFTDTTFGLLYYTRRKEPHRLQPYFGINIGGLDGQFYTYIPLGIRYFVARSFTLSTRVLGGLFNYHHYEKLSTDKYNRETYALDKSYISMLGGFQLSLGYRF